MRQNFDLQKELAERSDKDWRFGALSVPGLVSIPLAEREQWLPKGELQYDQFGDFQDCASRSPCNALEALFTYHYHHNMLPANKLWMEQKGYVTDGKVTFSDRWVAYGSGTSRSGNSLKAPLDFIYRNGLIPKKLLPKEEWMQWEDYYDATKITQEMRDLGQDFLARFALNYEQVDQIHFADVLKDDMIGVAGYAWPAPANGVYPRSDLPFNHAFLLYQLPKYQIFDNYLDWDNANTHKVDGDFTKNLASDYAFYEVGYRLYLSSEIDVALKINLLRQLLDALKRLLGLLQAKPTPTPVPAPQDPVVAPVAPVVVHPDGFAAGTLEERRAMFAMASRVCDEEGLSATLKRDVLLTIAGESGFNKWCKNNTTKDYGIAQFNLNTYCKEYKMTPQDCIDNPEKCVRIMCRNFKGGRQSNWVAYKSRFTRAPMLIQLSQGSIGTASYRPT